MKINGPQLYQDEFNLVAFDISMQEGNIKEFFREKEIHISIKANTNGTKFSSFDYSLFGFKRFILTATRENYYSALIAAIKEGFRIISKT